jgi:type II secretory pathway component PulJ
MNDRRRGAILLEAIAAGALLAVMLALVLRAMSATAVERRRMEHRAIALQEVAGAMERAAALPAQEISPETLDRIGLSPKIDDLLPRPKLTWTVTPDDSLAGAKHIRAVLTWQDRRGGRQADVHLDYWAFTPPIVAAQEAP